MPNLLQDLAIIKAIVCYQLTVMYSTVACLILVVALTGGSPLVAEDDGDALLPATHRPTLHRNYTHCLHEVCYSL